MILEWDEMDLPLRAAVRKKSLSSFLAFVQLWFELVQGDKLLVNWHHEYMAWAIDHIISGNKFKTPSGEETRNIIVNIPPGGTKTEFFSIHLPAYLAALTTTNKIRRFRNLNISYADTLVKRNSRRTRDIIASKEFQSFWPSSFGANQAEEWEIVDDRGRSIAQTISKSAGGQITGGRGGYWGPEYSGHIMLDDFNKPVDMFSETKRNSSNSMLVNTVRSRRGDKSKEHPTPIISIQQRLHTDDATGFMMSGGMGMPFMNIKIPALIDSDYIQSLPEPWRTKCWNCIKDSESMVIGGVKYWSYWPNMEYVGDLVALWEKDSYTFMSQYMQKPAALTGGVFDTTYFNTYTQLPHLLWRAVYVDTNSGKANEYNDYSVFTLVGLGVDGKMYIIDCERGKWDPADLLDKAVELWDRWCPNDPRRPAPLRHMGIEDKQAGQGLIVTLKKKYPRVMVKEIPRGAGENKVVRALNCVPNIKAGQVYIPATHDENGAPIGAVCYSDGRRAGSTNWVVPMIAEFADFSADDSHDHDDMVDTVMDGIHDMLIEGNNFDFGSIL